MLKIRPFHAKDFDKVRNKLIERNVEPPEELSDCGGIFLVAEEGGEIKGCIYALVGVSTKAYGDYFVADTPRTAFMLLQTLETVLRLNGINKIDFTIEADNAYFEKQAIKYGCLRLKDLKYYRRYL